MKESKKIIQRLATEISVIKFLDYREYLKAIYDGAKVQLDSYSYLRFAEDLGFSATNVVRLIMAGKRPMTVKAADKMAKGLALATAERRYWLTLVEFGRERLPSAREDRFKELLALKTKTAPGKLNKEQLEYFSNWYNPVIRELVCLDGFNGEAEWVRDHLSFSLRLEDIKKSLDLLSRIGFIRRDKSGRYQRTQRKIETDAEVDSLAIVSYHQQMIEMGKASITHVSENERDIRAVTASLPRSAIPLLKAKIDSWIQDVLEYEDNEEPNERVYQVNIQLFPFSKDEGEKS